MPTKSDIRESLTRLHRSTWETRTPEIEPGTYVLTDSTPNHDAFVDRRCSTDWRVKENLPAGEYVIEDTSHFRGDDEDYDGPPILRMWRVQANGTLYDVPCWDWRFWTIFELVVKQPETPSRWLTETRDENWALEILDILVEHGQISMRAVKAAKEAAYKKYDETHDDAGNPIEEGVAS